LKQARGRGCAAVGGISGEEIVVVVVVIVVVVVVVVSGKGCGCLAGWVGVVRGTMNAEISTVSKKPGL